MNAQAPRYRLFTETFVNPTNDWTPGGPTGGRWRFTLESAYDGRILEASGEEEDADADRLALLAIVRGLEALDQPAHVSLFTRNPYFSRGLRFGLDQWRENDWCWERFGDMVPITNVDLWQRVDRALCYHQVECRTWRLDEAQRGAPAPKLASFRRRQPIPAQPNELHAESHPDDLLAGWHGRERSLRREGPRRWRLSSRSPVAV